MFLCQKTLKYEIVGDSVIDTDCEIFSVVIEQSF